MGLQSGSRKPKPATSGHASSFGFWWGLTPKPLPASVYLSVKGSSAWEKIVVFELAWAQSFLPLPSQLVPGMGLRGCSPHWLASAKASQEGKGCLGPEAGHAFPGGGALFPLCGFL